MKYIKNILIYRKKRKKYLLLCYLLTFLTKFYLHKIISLPTIEVFEEVKKKLSL